MTIWTLSDSAFKQQCERATPSLPLLCAQCEFASIHVYWNTLFNGRYNFSICGDQKNKQINKQHNTEKKPRIHQKDVIMVHT